MLQYHHGKNKLYLTENKIINNHSIVIKKELKDQVYERNQYRSYQRGKKI